MATDNTKFNISDFIDQEIPAEILDQLKVAGRIQQVLTPTTASAVSTSAQESDYKGRPDIDPTKQLDGLIKDVDGLEDQVEQLEDLIDEHLKDMSIPPVNDLVASAAKRLGSEDGTITKDVLDTAMAIMDYWPMMTYGQDPVLAALVGDGRIDGNWVECNQITSALASELTHPPRNDYDSEEAIADAGAGIAEAHEKRLVEMILEILLQLWWNMLWPKFVVMAVIINPIRMAIAIPTDSVIGFFMKKRFRKKSKKWMKKKGPIHKLLNRLEKILLCRIPKLAYPPYDPIIEIDCSDVEETCPDESEVPEEGDVKSIKNEKGSVKQLGSDDEGNDGIIGEAIKDLCFTTEELLDGINKDLPTGFGASPECAKSAKVVLDAVLGDALTPSNGKGK